MNRQSPLIPDTLRTLMAEIGPKWGTSVQAHVKLMVQEFSKLLANAPKLGRVSKNIAYGDHARQVLDLYQPEGLDPKQAAPILMFVHGGAFVDGDKDRTSEVYSNVLWYFARHGVIGVNVEFRLAPEFKYPSGTQDIAAAVAWVRAHAASWGGDPDRIYLMGHSAGATHAGHYAGDAKFQPAEGSGLAGLIVVSGRVRAENGPENPNASRVEAYYGTDTDLMAQGSPVTHARPGGGLAGLPVMIAVAEYENPLIDVHCAELFNELSITQRRSPRFVWMAGHNHTSIVSHMNTAEEVLGQNILEFISTGR